MSDSSIDLKYFVWKTASGHEGETVAPPEIISRGFEKYIEATDWLEDLAAKLGLNPRDARSRYAKVHANGTFYYCVGTAEGPIDDEVAHSIGMGQRR